MIDVTRTVIRCERLPSGFDGFRITLVSDLHDALFGEEQSELLREMDRYAEFYHTYWVY